MTEQELNKACEWLEFNAGGYLGLVHEESMACATLHTAKMIKDFRKAMEAVIKDSLNPVQNDAEAVIKENLTTELTWQDVQKIVEIADEVITAENIKFGNEETYYSEVLRRFNKEESK